MGLDIWGIFSLSVYSADGNMRRELISDHNNLAYPETNEFPPQTGEGLWVGFLLKKGLRWGQRTVHNIVDYLQHPLDIS